VEPEQGGGADGTGQVKDGFRFQFFVGARLISSRALLRKKIKRQGAVGPAFVLGKFSLNR